MGLWEYPADELNAAPAAIHENDPNYADEEAKERILRGEVSDDWLSCITETGGEN